MTGRFGRGRLGGMSDRCSKLGLRLEGEDSDTFVPESGVAVPCGVARREHAWQIEGAFDTGNVVHPGGDPDPTGVIAPIDAALGVVW